MYITRGERLRRDFSGGILGGRAVRCQIDRAAVEFRPRLDFKEFMKLQDEIESCKIGFSNSSIGILRLAFLFGYMQNSIDVGCLVFWK